MINEKFIHEKTVYEFDLDSFERHQAYKITLPTIGLEDTECVGILVYADKSQLMFLVASGANGYQFTRYGNDGYSILTIDIDDYMKDTISIVKLGVVDNG